MIILSDSMNSPFQSMSLDALLLNKPSLLGLACQNNILHLCKRSVQTVGGGTPMLLSLGRGAKYHKLVELHVF